MIKPKKNFFIRAARRAHALVDEYAIRPFWGIVPRYIFGNNAGLLNNVLAALELHWQRLRSNVQCSSVNVAAEKLKRDGITQLPIHVPVELLATIKQQVQDIFSNQPEHVVEAGHPPYYAAHVMLKKPLETIPELATLLDEQIKTLISKYYGAHFKVTQVRCWRNNHVAGIDTEHPVYSNQWHNDQFNTNELKFFVYLSDAVSRETGAFRAFSIANTKRILRSFGYFRRSHIFATAKKLVQDTTKIHFIEGDVGTAFIVNATRCLHRAGIPRVGASRDIVQFCFRPASRPLPDNWQQQVLAESYNN